MFNSFLGVDDFVVIVSQWVEF